MIVLAVERPANDTSVVVVLPITHTPPADPASAVEIPTTVKRHLELDDERSWIVVAEGNEFDWPGYDIRKIGRSDRYDYGFLPPRFFRSSHRGFRRMASCPQSKARLRASDISKSCATSLRKADPAQPRLSWCGHL